MPRLARRSLGEGGCLRVSSAVAVAAIWVGSLSQSVFSHETLTTTVLFEREIVRVLDKHCVMCHSAGGPSLPLETYEEAWLKGRSIRSAVIARHMPPWAAVPGYGTFANDNSLTLRETQFVVSWVEGLGPRNAGRVFLNVQARGAPRPREIRAEPHVGQWRLGIPNLTRDVAAAIPPPAPAAGATRVVRTTVDLGLTTPRRLRGLEYMPGNRARCGRRRSRSSERGSGSGAGRPGTASTRCRPASPSPCRRDRASSRSFRSTHRRKAAASGARSGCLSRRRSRARRWRRI